MSPSNPTQPTPFPLYLLPSIPFRRRRQSSVSATTSPNSPSSSPPAPRPSFLSDTFTSYLQCQKCLTDLLPTSSIISKGFTGRHGRAYLVAPPPPSSLPTELRQGDLPNVRTHKAVPRQLVTGAHTVSDISCRICGSVLGWKYVEAEEESQRYKVGKFILETNRVVKGSDWETRDRSHNIDEQEIGGGRAERKEGARDEIEFNSQDEDECEDLFSGIWSQALARRRRRQMRFDRDE